MSGADEKIRAVADALVSKIYATHQCGSFEKGFAKFEQKAGVEALLPLLLAGQAMRDCNYINERNSMVDWDAALAAAQDQPEKESGR